MFDLVTLTASEIQQLLRVTPSNRGGLVCLKCGLKEIDTDGAFHYTDCIGFLVGMAKSVETSTSSQLH